MKAVRILRAVAREAAAVSLADLSAATCLPKPTAHRLMSELEHPRLVARDPLTRRYLLGPDLEDSPWMPCGTPSFSS